MPDLSDDIALAKANLYDAEQAIFHLRTHIDPQGWKAIKCYVDNRIKYDLLQAKKEAVHA